MHMDSMPVRKPNTEYRTPNTEYLSNWHVPSGSESRFQYLERNT